MIDAIFAWMARLYELLASATHLSPWVYLLVFAAGITSALSPCYIPVLALFAGYVGGYTRGMGTAGLGLALPFVAGNALTLALAGAGTALLGSAILGLFTGYQLDRWIPGLVGLVMGLHLMGVVRVKLPELPTVRPPWRPETGWRSFALGLPFGLVVTPCTVPIFFAIATFVAFQASVLHGALLMVAYALGRGAILIIVALSAGAIKALNVGRTAWYLERLSGALLLAVSVGLLLFYDAFVRFTGQWMLMRQ